MVSDQVVTQGGLSSGKKRRGVGSEEESGEGEREVIRLGQRLRRAGKDEVCGHHFERKAATYVKNTWAKPARVIRSDLFVSPLNRLPIEIIQYYTDDSPRIVAEAVLFESRHRDDAPLVKTEWGNFEESNTPVAIFKSYFLQHAYASKWEIKIDN